MNGEITRFELKTSYGKLNVYKRDGGEKQLLLLHGGGSDNALLSWREVMKSMDEEYTVYAPDLLGHGLSDTCDGITGSDFYKIHIDSIKQLVDLLSLKHFTLAGLSMGGAIAIGFALKHPDYVKCLIPVDSWGLSKRLPMHTLSYWYIHKTELALSQYRALAKSPALIRWSLAYSLLGNRSLITPELIEEVRQSCMADRAGLSMQSFQRSSSDRHRAIPYYVDELRQLHMPIHYIIGEKDPLVPLKDIKHAHEQSPNSRMTIFPACKHWPVKEKPELFCDIVKNEDYSANSQNNSCI